MKFSTLAFGLFAASAAVAAPVADAPAAIERRTPPGIPSTSTAKSLLAGLGVRTSDASGYSRFVPPSTVSICASFQHTDLTPF